MNPQRHPAWNIIAVGLAFILAAAVAYFVYQIAYAPTQDGGVPEAPPAAPSGWQETTSAGVTFFYPPVLPAEYITAVDWPPALALSGERFSCTEAGSEIERAGRTEMVAVGGRTYCRTTLLEGAAGSVYGQYAYAFPRGGGTAILTFTTRMTQCANYDEPARTACLDEREQFDLDALVDQIVRTLE